MIVVIVEVMVEGNCDDEVMVMMEGNCGDEVMVMSGDGGVDSGG